MADTHFIWRRIDDLSVREFHEIVALRESVFVVEQACAYPEVDALDLTALHLTMRVGEALAGYLRLIEGAEPAIGRVLIAPAFRGRGLARELMGEGIRQARRRYSNTTIHVSAQAYLLEFYESLGFAVTADRHMEDGIPHYAMKMSPSDRLLAPFPRRESSP